MKPPVAEVRIVFDTKGAKLTLKLNGRVAEEDVFAGKAPRKTVVEVAQVLFDDAYDLTSYSLHGFSDQRR